MERPIATSVVEPSARPKPKLKVLSPEEIAARKAARIPLSPTESLRLMNQDYTTPRYGLGIANRVIDTINAQDLVARLAKQRAALDSLIAESETAEGAKLKALMKKIDTQEKNMNKTSKELKEVLDGYPIPELYRFRAPPRK